MADTGFKNPTGTGRTYNFWTDPINAYTQDGNYATFAITQNLNQDYHSFDFSIPAGSVINGIEVRIRGHCEAANRMKEGAKVSWDGGISATPVAAKTTDFWGVADADYFLGGPADKWGREWTIDEFSNANFDVRFQASYTPGPGKTGYVDHVQVKVYYTPPVGKPTAQIINA